MITRLVEPPPGIAPAAFFQASLRALSAPGELGKRIAEIERHRSFRRLFVMGCGRSGTWLLTAALSTFAGVDILPKEVAIENFGLLSTDQAMLVLKRGFDAYKHVKTIPSQIEIVTIVRHPFAVLTSYNATTGRKYHISPERWQGEMQALRHLVEARRRSLTIVRYEDLVTTPERTQARLAERLGLAVLRPIADVHKVFNAPPEAVAAMHGLRPIDSDSLDKFRHDPEKMAYLRSIRRRLGQLLRWIADEYGYDISV